MKRLFDILLSIILLIFLLPFFFMIAFLIKLDSKGPVFYIQKRVGQYEKLFNMFKFRSMHPFADKKGLLTISSHDSRITKIGYYLRKYKMDELPQLINVLLGDMSFVGPRPEVPKYVAMYDENQKKVLDVKPGITDWASLKYINESDLLAKSKDAEALYINEIMPAKLNLNLKYITERSFWIDLQILWKTVVKVF